MRNENCRRGLPSPEENADLALPSPQKPPTTEEAIEGFLKPIAPFVKSFGKSTLDAYELAEEKVRAEHPEWFIKYPAKKKIDSDRRRKMMSRAKKKRYAIQAEIKNILGKTPSEMLEDVADEMKVVLGTADEKTEIDYLEQALERGDPES